MPERLDLEVFLGSAMNEDILFEQERVNEDTGVNEYEPFDLTKWNVSIWYRRHSHSNPVELPLDTESNPDALERGVLPINVLADRFEELVEEDPYNTSFTYELRMKRKEDTEDNPKYSDSVPVIGELKIITNAGV